MRKVYSTQIEEVHGFLIKLASGDFTAKLSSADYSGKLAAIVTGINMLTEELQDSTVSRDYLNSIYKGIVDMLIVLNPDNTIRQVNSATCKLLLYEESELIGKPLDILFLKDKNYSEPFEGVNSCLFTEGFCYNIERNFQTRTGNIVPVSCSCSILYDKQKAVSGILYIAKDISKIKKTEEQLKLKNEELNNFIYKSSHDLKTPLASTQGLINLIKTETDTLVVQKYLDLIGHSLGQLGSILEKLTLFEYITSAHLQYSVIDFGKIIEKTLKKLNYLPDSEGIKINILHKKPFKGIEELIGIIFYHLIDNSLKYNRKNVSDSNILIEITDSGNGINIKVSDKGIGIEEKSLSAIFKMFYKASTNSKGNGLGLYLVNAAVDRLNGIISVESKLREGTTFLIYLPNTI